MAKKPQNTAGNRNEDSAPQERKWPDKAIIRYIIRALVLLIVFAWALVNLDAVLRFLGTVLALFTPFLIGGAIAFLINVVLRPLECCWNKVCRRAPEKQMAKWAAIRFTADHIFDYIEIDEQHAIFEVQVPEAWVRKSVGELDVRRKFGINILGIKRAGKTDVSVTPDTVLSDDITILTMGEYKVLQKCFRI